MIKFLSIAAVSISFTNQPKYLFLNHAYIPGGYKRLGLGYCHGMECVEREVSPKSAEAFFYGKITKNTL